MLLPLTSLARYGTQRWSGPRCPWCHSFSHTAAVACPLRKLCLPPAQLPLQPHPHHHPHPHHQHQHPVLGVAAGREHVPRAVGREAGDAPAPGEGGEGAGQGGGGAAGPSKRPGRGPVLHAPLDGPLLPPGHVVPPEVDADMHVYGAVDPVVPEPGGAAAAAVGGLAGVVCGERSPGGVAGARRRPGGCSTEAGAIAALLHGGRRGCRHLRFSSLCGGWALARLSTATAPPLLRAFALYQHSPATCNTTTIGLPYLGSTFTLELEHQPPSLKQR